MEKGTGEIGEKVVTPDLFIERKRNKQQMRLWKLGVLLLIFLLIVVIRFSIEDDSSQLYSIMKKDFIASIYIDGVIDTDKVRDRKLTEIKDNSSIKALIVYINSPGGGVVGSEHLYYAIRKIAEAKPVVIVMDSLAASGGYMASLAGDYIIAHSGTVTGSIGVVWQNPEITELADKVGVKFDLFKSNKLKAAPNPFEKTTREVEEVVMESIYDTHNFFVDLVSERRNIPREEVLKIADGRIYTGSQAYKLKLIDQVGNTDDALLWLQKNKDISDTLKIIEVSLKNKTLIENLVGPQNKVSTFLNKFNMEQGLYYLYR